MAVVVTGTKRETALRRTMDQRFFAIVVAWIWLGILGGFGFDISRDLSKGPLHFLPIVHVHAAVFVGWMVLFTIQLLLIRAGKPATHKRLGCALAGYVVLMVVLGLVTTYQVDTFRASHPGTGDPTFFVIAATDMLAFAVLACAGLSMRKSPDIHKRLMLLAAIYITDAGFARLAPFVVVPLVHDTFWQTFVISYIFTDVAMIALGVYDWMTRGRLYPAYVIAMLFIGGVELLATWMYVSSPALHATVLRFLSAH